MRLRRIALYVLINTVCLTAIASALEIKDKTYSTETAGTVVFKHSSHLKKKNPKSPNISCKSCHNDNFKKEVRYTMAQMEQGKSCGICHGKTAFPLSRCTACHKVKDVTYKLKETGLVVFRHSTHLKKHECGACHNELFKTGHNPKVSMAEMEKGKSCGACHNGSKAFSLASCTACHPVKNVKYVEKTSGTVTFSHTSHLVMYKCGDCHTKIYSTTRSKEKVSMKEMEQGKSCGACHDGKTGFTVMENCATCHKL